MNNTKNTAYYLEFVQSLAASDSDDLFHNKGEDYASIVMGEIFSHCKKELRIYSNSMNPKVTDKPVYFDNLVKFLEKENVKIKLIVEDEEQAFLNSPSFGRLFLSSVLEDKVEIKHSNKKNLFKSDGEPIHFMTGDDRMFRLEFDVENHKAQCSFNRPDYVKSLNQRFDEAFEMLPSLTNSMT